MLFDISWFWARKQFVQSVFHANEVDVDRNDFGMGGEVFWVVIITENYQNLPKTTKNLPKTKLPKTKPNPNHNPNSEPQTPNPKLHKTG